MLADLRYAVRTLRKSPGYTTVAALTLALGIGANAAVFSALNGVLLRPLPYRDADRLYLVWERSQSEYRLASYPTFVDWRAQSYGLAGLASVRGRTTSLHGSDGAARVLGAAVSDGFFDIVGGQPLVGRTFSVDEERPSGPRVVVLTYDLWQRVYGGDPAVLGTAMKMDEASYAIIGVLPPGFRYPDWADFYTPLAAVLPTDSALGQRGLHADSRVIVRLKPDATVEQARTELAGIQARLAAAYPKENAGWTGVDLLPLREEVLGFGAVRPILLVLSAAVALVLLIACANVASTSLVRAVARSRELAIRAALGSGRGRVIRQLATEAAVLTLLGGAGGLVLAFSCVAALKAAAPAGLPRLDEIAVDGWVLGFATLISLVVALLVGVIPAVRATAGDLTESLKEGTPGAGSHPTRSRLRFSVAALEIALALMLLVGAGLLIRSVWRLSHVDPGFDPTGIAALDIFPPAGKYTAPENALALYGRVAEAIAPLPGVEAVALSNHLPLSGAFLPSRIDVPGHPREPGRDESVLFRTISAEYFRTMKIPVRRGRAFTGSDVAARAPLALANETLARRYWPDQDPIGRTVTLFKSAQGRPDFGQPFAVTVIGVVGDVRHVGLDADAAPEVYVPYTVNPWGHMVVVVRTRADPETLLPALRRAVAIVDPAIPVSRATRSGGFETMGQLLRDQLARRRFTMTLLTAFAIGALLLAALGIHGVMSYVLTLRTREIGIRTALGATGPDVAGLLMAQAIRVVGAGLVTGLAGAVALTRLIRTLLYGVGATDPVTFGGVALLLAAVALAASWLPARRAARVDPMVALRSE